MMNLLRKIEGIRVVGTVNAAEETVTATATCVTIGNSSTLVTVMPSSAAAERVFSLLNNQFNESQTRTLSDQIFSHSISPTICVVDESLLCLNLLGKLDSFNSI
jgi:hypothetical protein